MVSKITPTLLLLLLAFCLLALPVEAGTPKTNNTYQITAPTLTEIEAKLSVMNAPFVIAQTGGNEDSPSAKIRVQVTNQPEGSVVEFDKVNPADGSTLNVINNDYSPTGSFVIPANTNHTDYFNIKFSKEGDYTILYSLIDLNEANPYIASTNFDVTVLPSSNTPPKNKPDASGKAKIDSNNPEVFITSPTQAVTLTVADGTSNPLINLSALVTAGAGVLPQFTINSSLANVSIQASTAVISADTSWNGVLLAPSVSTGTIPLLTSSTTIKEVVEIGFSGAKLSFDRAVRISLPYLAGYLIGYTGSDLVFHEITNICTDDSLPSGNALPSNEECKIDVGADLVIWTKHFTKFLIYSYTLTNPTDTGTSTPPLTSSSTLSGIRNSISSSLLNTTSSTSTQGTSTSSPVNPILKVPPLFLFPKMPSTSTPATTTQSLESSEDFGQTASADSSHPATKVILWIAGILIIAGLGFKVIRK